MAQWVNCLRNNIFVNPPPLPLLCEIWNPVPSVTGSYGRLADEIQVNFEIFKIGCKSNIQLVAYSLTNAFQLAFSDKAYCKVDF